MSGHPVASLKDLIRKFQNGGLSEDEFVASFETALAQDPTTPSQAAVRAELQARLQEALAAMDPVDREVLALRHFEQLSNSETAQVLGLRESAASQRYARALLRLKDILTSLPGSQGEV